MDHASAHCVKMRRNQVNLLRYMYMPQTLQYYSMKVEVVLFKRLY